jgi:hypothetical protein
LLLLQTFAASHDLSWRAPTRPGEPLRCSWRRISCEIKIWTRRPAKRDPARARFVAYRCGPHEPKNSWLSQVYVDVGIISYALPRAGFHDYLRRIVEAGFGKCVMFGSDQMVCPETLETAIQSIEQAAFLTPEQKRDIFYNNAPRFLRLTETEITRHTGQ